MPVPSYAVVPMCILLLFVSLAIAIAYYAAYRKKIDAGSIAVATLACYGTSFAIVSLTISLSNAYLSEYVLPYILFAIPVILAINIPLLTIALEMARSSSS